jgi:hypothetical protein
MKTITITDDGKKTTSKMMAELKKNFSVYCYWNDEELDRSFPQPQTQTEREFPLEAEPTEKGKSWNDLADIRKRMMTFREYILFFKKFHEETGKYPDEIGWTILQDRLAAGDVALGNWYPDNRKVRFNWNNPGLRDDSSGARLAISLKPSSSLTLEKRVTALEEKLAAIATLLSK